MIHHIKRATRHLVFWSLVTVAVSLTVLRLSLSGIEHYKAGLAARISELVGAPVKIGRLSAKMQGFNPEILLKDIAVSSLLGNLQPAIQLKEIRLGVNLFNMLVSRELLSSTWVTLVGAKISVKRKLDGSFAVVGLKAGDEQPLWLLQGSKYQVLQSQISWQDEQGRIKDMVLDGVDLEISNRDQHHKMNVLVQLPKKYGDQLTLSMDLNGNLFAPSSIDGKAYIEGKNINLAEWVEARLPFAVNLSAGYGSFKVWSELQHSQLVSLSGSAQMEALQFTGQDNTQFPVKQLSTDFHASVDGTAKQWQFGVKHFLLETAETLKSPARKWPDAVFSIAGQFTDDNALQKAGLRVKQMDLQEASYLVRFFAPLSEQQHALLTQAQLKGSLEGFALYVDREQQVFAVNGKFTGIGIAPLSKMPGIANLTGAVKGTEKAGLINFETKDAKLVLPALFRDEIIIKRLQGGLGWRQSENDWTLTSQLIELDVPNLQSKTRLDLTVPKNDDLPFMDMQIALACDDVSKLKHYLPAHVMKPTDVIWLDRAFVSGRISKGRVLYYGKLRQFPTAGSGTGVFEALLDIEQGELNYAPTWPNITDIKAEAAFLQNRMEINASQGQSDKLVASKVNVINTALGKSKQLLVQGELEGKIADVLNFLAQTPLANRTGNILKTIVPEGNTQVTLDMVLPLQDGNSLKVDGNAQLNNARVKVKPLALWVNQINGELKFNELGIYSDTIHAEALNHPILIDIDNVNKQTAINITGKADIIDLRNQFKMPGWDLARGGTDYQLKLKLPYDLNAAELDVKSRLVGVELSLPGQLAKSRTQEKSLALRFSLGDSAYLPITLNYDNKLKVAFKLDADRQTIYSGHVLLGSGEVAQPKEAGLILEINQDPLDLHEWLGLSVGQSGNTGNINAIKVHSQHAHWKQTPLGEFDIELKPDGQYWAGTINAPFAKGKVHFPAELNNTGIINLDMDLLDLSALKQLKSQSAGQATGLSPKDLPLFTITSDKTLWNSVDLGMLTLTTERIADGIAFKQMELNGIGQKLVIAGDWKITGHGSQTQMQGRLEMPSAGLLLDQLGITRDMTETRGNVNFTFNWHAAPYQFALADLQGSIDIDFKGGRILSVEPGFGRVLGILAMAQWVKRLQLDFSDVFEEGLTFNKINGHFNLTNGVAATDNLVVDAIAAKINITGDTNLVNKTVDQLIKVTPKSADAVPIAGTIMGKVTSLIAQSLTGKDQDGFFFGSEYQVKGKWNNMQIITLHENEGLVQKTWNSITNFPSLFESQQHSGTPQRERK